MNPTRPFVFISSDDPKKCTHYDKIYATDSKGVTWACCESCGIMLGKVKKG